VPTPPERPSIGVDLRALVGTPTGIGYYTRSLLKALAGLDRFRLVGMAHAEPVFADELRSAGLEIEVRKAISGVVWQQTTVPRRLSRGDIDLFWSPILTLPLVLPVPAVTTVHDLTPLLHPETHRLKVKLSILPFLARTLSKAAGVIADSQATATDLERYFPDCAPRLRVIYPGVDPIFKPADSEQIQQTRESLDCPAGYLLYSGTLEPRKNLSLLLDAWEQARLTDSAVPPLILSGPAGWADQGLFKQLKRLEPLGARWLGRLERSRLVEVMQAASWFVYPSLYEGFGLPVAEAMACGIPPIVSNVSSLPEVVGDCGFQVDPTDVADLANLLAALPTDPAERRAASEAARTQAQRFSWATAADEITAAFSQALAGATV
jgi:glycosyltransferase involved in cell wall biosynthesis